MFNDGALSSLHSLIAAQRAEMQALIRAGRDDVTTQGGSNEQYVGLMAFATMHYRAAAGLAGGFDVKMRDFAIEREK